MDIKHTYDMTNINYIYDLFVYFILNAINY